MPQLQGFNIPERVRRYAESVLARARRNAEIGLELNYGSNPRETCRLLGIPYERGGSDE